MTIKIKVTNKAENRLATEQEIARLVMWDLIDLQWSNPDGYITIDLWDDDYEIEVDDGKADL